MAALYDSDDLDHGAAKDYMAYTAKIGELASRYTWASVLAYDQEYRRRQAADSQHLCTVLLKEKAATPTGIKPRGGQTAAELDPAAKKCAYNTTTESVLMGPRCNFELPVSAVPTGPPPVGSSPATGGSQAGIGSAAVSGSAGRTFPPFPTR